METVTFVSVLNDTADLLGLDADNLSTAEFKRLSRAINRRARFAWNLFRWPEWCYCEERTTSTAADSAKIITAAATGKSTIGRVFNVWDQNPYGTVYATTVAKRERNDGWFVNSTATSLWVEYRKVAPIWLGSVWTAGTYASGAEVYYSTAGNFYLSNTGSNTDTPGSAKWDIVSFPRALALYASVAAATDIRQKTEGSPEKTTAWEREHIELLQHEFDTLEREENLVDNLPMRVECKGL